MIRSVNGPRFCIGQQFWTRGKNPRLCTIDDIHLTYRSDGKLVKVRYVASHEFAGQKVTDTDVVGATIAMGLVNSEAA